jgi:hypothetical protein
LVHRNIEGLLLVQFGAADTELENRNRQRCACGTQKNKCAIPPANIKEPMISAIPKEIVSGGMMARIPQTKVTVLQTINHGDAFFMAGVIDPMFIRVTDRSSEFVQLL